ncbi:MAG: hypothetical protein IT210_16945 [Armatimonadetes bacterium]|nr:hypothetical protein [Armatimonadota bacterium]
MTSRQRQLAAIRHEMTDRISVDAICVETPREITSFLNIAPDQVLQRLGLDRRAVTAGGYAGEFPDGPEDVREWGTLETGEYGASRSYPLAAASSVREIERYPWPDPSLYDYEAAGRYARQVGEEYAVRGPYWKPLFCMARNLFGMAEALVRSVAEPAVFEAVLEYACLHVEEFCRRLLDACGDAMPVLSLGDDFATQRGLMISPAAWRAFLKPRYARLFRIAKERGKYVWFHSCGDITPVLPDLIDIGMDVWETVQLHALPMPPEILKREYSPSIAFFGGVNTQTLPFASLEEVLRCIEVLGRDGGYICGPDHHIKPDVPPANAAALFDIALAFRREGYTLSEKDMS